MMQMRHEAPDLGSDLESRILLFPEQSTLHSMAAKSTRDGVVQTDGTPGGAEDARQIPELERQVQSYLSTEGQTLQAYMGRHIHLDWIASDDLGQDTVAAILKGEDYQGRAVNVFIGHRDFDSQVKKIEKGYGLKNVEEAKLYVLSHEMLHAMGILSEVGTERTLHGYFMEQAHKYYKMSDKAPHPRLQDEYLERARMYKRLAKTAQYRANLGEEALRGKAHYHKGGHDKHEDHGKHQHGEHENHGDGHGHGGGHESHEEYGHESHGGHDHDDDYSTGKDHWTRKNAPHGGHGSGHDSKGEKQGHDRHKEGDHAHHAPQGKDDHKGQSKPASQGNGHVGGHGHHHGYVARSYTPNYRRGPGSSGSYQARQASSGNTSQKNYTSNAKR